LVNAFEDGQAARAAWARDVALFRYGMIRAAADPDLSPQQRGALVRALAAGEHKGPDGRPVRPGRSTLDRWIRDWRAGGFDALMPGGRQVSPRTSAGVLELAVALKKEKPDRSAAQVRRILAMRLPGQVPTARTIQRHFVRMELTGLAAAETAPETFGRFEAGPGELWVSDVLHGPVLGGGKSYLFAVEDDHSRFITGHWWTTREDTLGLFAALRRAVEAHGAPKIFYVDNGSPYVSRQLLHALATLGIKITHSRPRRPQGKGKVERLFETVRAQFLVEVTAADGTAGQAGTALESIDQLEELFAAWVHQVYHQARHSGTGQTPGERFHAGGSVLTPLDPEVIDEAFSWQDFRTVTKTGTVSLHGNRYEVDHALAGRKAELLYNPLDLTCGIRVRYRGTEMGTAIPHVIGRHSHPQASPAAPAPAQPTGIDYLRMVAGQHRAGQAAAINFRALTGGQDQDAPGEPG
jgi:putative transposase